ncbi:hypothetical protein [Sediminispirochaeta bajacaliforniensis]|uniref:hypothetical protein n=1 Tax=Sediminispirochaeta bajacaliforniensis TaxID=148 RepID=UPI00036BC2BC|nr:hypothetical protein [Sediminispirochaeta bajacaliforniensis]
MKSRKFTLPDGRGFSAELGTKISGEMRPAKVKDFIAVQRDSRVKENSGALYVSLLSRVVEKIGTEKSITTRTIGRLSPADFTFLVDFFNELNHGVLQRVPVSCSCGEEFLWELHLPGEV